MTPHSACRRSFGLGLLSLMAILAANMALADIYHGETDLTLEWRVLHVSFVIIIVFHVVGLLTLWKAGEPAPRRGNQHG